MNQSVDVLNTNDKMVMESGMKNPYLGKEAMIPSNTPKPVKSKLVGGRSPVRNTGANRYSKYTTAATRSSVQEPSDPPSK